MRRTGHTSRCRYLPKTWSRARARCDAATAGHTAPMTTSRTSLPRRTGALVAALALCTALTTGCGGGGGESDEEGGVGTNQENDEDEDD